MKLLLTLTLMTLLPQTQAFAAEGTAMDSDLQKPVLVAQVDGDDAYDPFSDYSEFDEASDEEADINFFRNGRLFVLEFAGGMRGFTDNLGSLYSSGPSYGLSLCYFFDLRLALQMGFATGDYGYELPSQTGPTTGNISMTFLDISLKHYFNTQNVTRGLADLNPYGIAGFSQTYRTLTIEGASGRDATLGMHFGAGIEIPLMRKKAFFGVQGLYRYFNFKDENQILFDRNNTSTGMKPTGDSYELMGILGLNF